MGFVPVISGRSIVRGRSSITVKKLERWRRIITEAAEQSGRGKIPELAEPLKLEDALIWQKEFDLSLMGSAQREVEGLRSVLGQRDIKTNNAIAVFIGPEGGFTEEELQRGRDNGIIEFSLGRRILRTETAAVVASALILYESEQMER